MTTGHSVTIVDVIVMSLYLIPYLLDCSVALLWYCLRAHYQVVQCTPCPEKRGQ